jgi:hypothetical protein
MPQETINIFLALLAFGAFHSLTAAARVKKFVRSLMGERIFLGWYRLLYNVLSIVTLAPALYLATIETGQTMWSLDGTLAAVFKKWLNNLAKRIAITNSASLDDSIFKKE